MRKGKTATEGKKRRTGPPKGNLNAARSVVPALKRLAQGKVLPPELERICLLADFEAAELVSDRGGLDNMSGAEKLMINSWTSARRAELLIWHELLSRDAIHVNQHGGWDLAPGLTRLSGFLWSQQRALTALGLERKAKPVPNLADYLRSKGEESK
jgi:hypothetical protein